ncbi:MAG: hypothetical protein LBD59_04385 [Prevotellaceae bacterium]|jgi:hypothetical protein|nr:hypothetical protein [Prevotellaceae bacterium]
MKRILFLYFGISLIACTTSENAAPDLTVGLATIEFGNAESSQKVYVESNTSWSSTSSQNWCKASILQKFGSDTVKISVEANSSTDERIAYISFEVAGKTAVLKTVKVIQRGVPQRVLDSLTLVRFYEATDGDNWTVNDGWKTSKLEDWHGITVENDRIVGVKFENNNLRGAIDELKNLKNIDTLSIVSERGVTGSFPVEFTQLPNLRYLNLTGLSIAGNIPVEIAGMSSLKTLILSSNPLLNRSVPVPVEIGQLVGLTTLALDSMKVSDTVVFAGLKNLEYLSLDSCGLDTGFPPSILEMTNLKYLSLNNNMLDSRLPADLSQLTNLETLILSNNSFTGAIPQELTGLNLQTLRLENNHFSGVLPDEFIDKDGVIVCPQKGTNFSNHICP